VSRIVGSDLPPDLQQRLSGRDLEPLATLAIPIVTVDDDERAHPALLSYFEVAAKDAAHVRIAVWSTSSTSRNLRERGRVTLLVLDERVAYYVKARATELTPSMRCTPWNAAFDCRVEQVLADEADREREGGVYLTGGVTYANPEGGAALDRARRVISELLALG
jgi:hypothetical protein